jgi:hypothetical protein
MARYKVLKGVAHNIGHSFTSTMNYASDDYTLGHILRFALESGQDTLTIDFVNGEGEPTALLREPISMVPQWYTKMFWNMVASSGSDRTLIESAKLTLRYDVSSVRSAQWNGHPEGHYVCDVSITDIRGKIYVAHFADWWYSEKPFRAPSKVKWWNPLSWFRRVT